MEQMLIILQNIGMPADEVERIRAYYQNDNDGLLHYVMYMQAMFDDRHEYV